MRDGTLPMTLVMQSKVNMSEMFYVLVKNGVDISSYDINATQELAESGMVIDPRTAEYLQTTKSGKLIDPEMEAVMSMADRSFWQKVTLLDQEQVSELIDKFHKGLLIDIDSMLAIKGAKIIEEAFHEAGYEEIEKDEIKVSGDQDHSEND